MSFRPNGARTSWLVGCLVLAIPLSALAFPPADGKPGDRGGCDMPMRGSPGPSMGPPGFFFGDRPPPYLMGLKLSEDQQDKVFVILHAAAPAMREQGKAVRKARESLHDLGRATSFDSGNAGALAQSLGKAESQLALLQARADHDIYAVLTDEQRKELADRDRERQSHPHDGPPPR